MGCGICLVSADEFEKQFTRAIRKAALRAEKPKVFLEIAFSDFLLIEWRGTIERVPFVHSKPVICSCKHDICLVSADE